MRVILTTLLALAGPAIGFAHTLDGDATLHEQLGHQLTGSHHLPILFLIGLGAVLLARRALGMARRKDRT